MMEFAYHRSAALLRPFLAQPFPGRWRVFANLVNDPRWEGYWNGRPLRWTRCKNTGLWIPCDLSVFSGRIAWYFRRWYEIDTQSAILSLLPEGGTFIDIGANVGMASLSAAAAIGPNGRIVAFEPNPAVASIYSEGVRRNGLEPVVTLHNAAVGETPGKMAMFVPASNHGEASLATAFSEREGRTIEVEITDASPLAELDRVDLIKIDVEGFELTVLRALEPILVRLSPPVIGELMDEHLARAGTSSQAVVQYMERLGYVPYVIQTEDVGLTRQRARLSAFVCGDGPANCNVLFMPDSVAADRLEFVPLSK